MYQVPNNFSFRVQDDEQRNILNALADELQTDKKFDNAREFTFAIVSAYRILQVECKQLKSKNIQLEDKLNSNVNTTEFKNEDDAFTPNADVNTDEFKPADDSIIAKNKLIEEIGYEEIPTDKELFSDLYEIITMPPADDEPKVKEVITEILREPKEHEVYLELSPAKLELLEKIIRFRVKKGDDPVRLTKAQAIIKMAFNRGSLRNEHGYFKTYITGSRM